MPDLLVKLYELPEPGADRPLPTGVMVRRGLAPERGRVLDWVTLSFNERWASECALAFSAQPVTTWIATRDDAIVGFACADATAKGFFGPTGVAEAERGKGVGVALLLATLRGMREAGYAYAIIGGCRSRYILRKALRSGGDTGLQSRTLPAPPAAPMRRPRWLPPRTN